MRLNYNGTWKVVTIDDFFPCYLHGGPIFTYGNGNELWVMLVEKAYAKVHGTYYNLCGGQVKHAL